MKKIYLFLLIVTVYTQIAHAASTPLGAAIASSGAAPQYLISAADAWASVIGTPLRSGMIATHMSDMQNADENGRLYEVMSALAFNHTAMTIFETNKHLDAAYGPIDEPLMGRRSGGDQNFIVSARGIGVADKFDHGKNDDFEMRTGGGSASAYAYITDGFTFGVGYTYARSKTHDMSVKATASSNIITLFSKYLADNGWYMNTALAAGQTRWDIDKTIAGVVNDTSYDTDFYSAQMETGIQMRRGYVSISPEIGMRYTRMISDKHIDAAAQNFKKWWYNTLTANGGIRLGLNIPTYGMVIQPNVYVGGSYDIIHNGTDKVSTRVITGQSYDMPVHAPDNAAFRGGIGASVYGPLVSGDVTYYMDARKDYYAHNIRVALKVAF